MDSIAGLDFKEAESPARLTGRGARKKHIAVFGAGISGLAAAHELAKRGHSVSVYEATAQAGGFFRSTRMNDGFATEYSWHGFGPWYHNVFDLLKDVPFDAGGTLYTHALSRPIDFGIFPNRGRAGFYDHGLKNIPRMFRFTVGDWLPWAWLMLKVWSARRRSEDQYSRMNADAAWGPGLKPEARTAWRASFGPWIGSDWTQVSLHHAGHFFRKQLTTRPRHAHPADAEGPAWSHGAGDGWLLLRGPSSECWFDRWLAHLRTQGVRLNWNSPLARLLHEDNRLTQAQLESGEEIEADHYILATTPFAAAKVLSRTPELEGVDQLNLFRPLVQDGPHVQVSFQLGFAETIHFPRKRVAVVLADSEFNLTLFAQEQAWFPGTNLGKGVRSLWTGTSCVSTIPGKLFGLPVNRCNKEQFIAEVRAQILACEALDSLVREANGGRGIADFQVDRIAVWDEWRFSSEGIAGPQPKWVTTTRTQPYLPSQATPIENLVLAGAHTRTQADIWSIEGAVESGRRAARIIDSRVPVIEQHIPRWLRILGCIDDACYAIKAPHVLDLLLAGAVVGTALALFALVVS